MENKSSGRNKKFEGEVLYFGMKVTPQEKARIKKLALVYNTTATEAVMIAVDGALKKDSKADEIPVDRRLSADELLAMDKKTRSKIIKEQAKLIAKYDDSIEDGFDIIDD